MSPTMPKWTGGGWPAKNGERVEVSWNIHVACNFDCAYCFYHGHWDDFAPGNRYLPPEEWARHWDRFNDRHGETRIDIAGGEPFVYPRFLDILGNLSRRNHVAVATNLSWPVEPFLSRISPERVCLYASFHPQYFPDPEPLIAKLVRLKAAGFLVDTNFVAYPPLLPDIPKYVARFESRGIRLQVSPFRGTFAGRDYPGSYAGEARAYLDRLVSEDFGDWAALARQYVLEQTPTKGLPCNAGATYARIQHDGRVSRCSEDGREEALVGSFFDEDFRLWAGPRPCPFQTCSCVSEVIYAEGGPRGPAGSAHQLG